MPDLTPIEGVLGLVGALTAGGFLTAVWSSLVGRKARELSETELLQKMSMAFREEVRIENRRLESRLDQVIQAMVNLTDAVDDFLIRVPDVPDDERRKLRKANNEAKLAT